MSELPRFLSRHIAQQAMQQAVALASNAFRFNLSRSHSPMFHIVILVPKMEYDADAYPDCPITPHLLAEYSYGNKEEWPHHFDEIARCKALQLWQGRNLGGTDSAPHLLLSGDTPFWGGVARDGIVVACSGDKPWIDRMISGITADIAIALAYNECAAWKMANPKLDFV
jgi:hypothetical protein